MRARERRKLRGEHHPPDEQGVTAAISTPGFILRSACALRDGSTYAGLPRVTARRLALLLLGGLAVAGASIFFVVSTMLVRTERSEALARARLVAGEPAAQPRALGGRFLHDGVVAAALYGRDGKLSFSTGAPGIARTRYAVAKIGASGQTVQNGRLVDAVVPLANGGVLVLSTPANALASSARRVALPIAAALELLLVGLCVVFLPLVRRVIRQTEKHVRAAEADALHDALTRLPNRRLFEDRVAHTIAQAQRDESSAAVMLVDLDRFKEINDMLGHAAGDALLQEIAGRLRSVLRASDTVARVGGDEFAVVLANAALPAVHDTARRLQAAIEIPVLHEGALLAVGASIGVAIYPDHAKSPALLQRHADAAMYQAKRSGVGHVVFDPGTTESDEQNHVLVAQLPGALERGEIVLHYQPTVALASGEVRGVEALLRWKHPVLGLLSADRFVPLAERAGVRAELDELALVAAIRQAGVWRRVGLTISVLLNLEARTLLDRDLPGRIERLLEEHGVDPHQIEAEISEAALHADPDRISAVALELAALGIVLVVDDFGADHTSLNTLAYLPIVKLKIDRTLLARALDSRRDEIVFAGIVELAHRLGLEVVATGVEDETALELIRDVGVDFGQGYHLGAPVDPYVVERRLAVREAVAA